MFNEVLVVRAGNAITNGSYLRVFYPLAELC